MVPISSMPLAASAVPSVDARGNAVRARYGTGRHITKQIVDFKMNWFILGCAACTGPAGMARRVALENKGKTAEYE
jgi:hypothetical protein